MSKVPPLVEDLIWQIAEDGDPQAVLEFERRYPEFVPELEKRMAMVRQIRLARPSSPDLRFAPRPAPVRGPWPRTAWAAVGLLGASLAFATFMAVRPKPAPVKPGPAGITANSGSSQEPTGTVWGPRDVPIEPGAGSGGQQAQQPPPTQAPASPFDRPVTLDSSSIMLSQAIVSIATQARLRLDIAPLFEDRAIEAHYTGLTARQVLEDLGQNFGFSLVVQQGNEALIIPALDPNKPPTNLPNDSYSLPSDQG